MQRIVHKAAIKILIKCKIIKPRNDCRSLCFDVQANFYLHPALKYSEDIDLVQIKEGPIEPIMRRIGDQAG